MCGGIFEDIKFEFPTLATSGNKIPRSMSSSLVARTDIFLSKPRLCIVRQRIRIPSLIVFHTNNSRKYKK